MSIDISNVTINKMSSDTAQVILDIYTNYKCLDKLFIDKYLYMSTDTTQVIMQSMYMFKNIAQVILKFVNYILKLLNFTHLQTLPLLVMHNHLQILILK